MNTTSVLILIVVSAAIEVRSASTSLAQTYRESTMSEADSLSAQLLALHNQERSQAEIRICKGP